MEYQSLVGITAGILTAVSMLPQVVKMFREKKASQVSLVMILVLMAGISLWIWYGVLINDFPILITNSFSLAVNFILIILRIKYRNNRDEPNQEVDKTWNSMDSHTMNF